MRDREIDARFDALREDARALLRFQRYPTALEFGGGIHCQGGLHFGWIGTSALTTRFGNRAYRGGFREQPGFYQHLKPVAYPDDEFAIGNELREGIGEFVLHLCREQNACRNIVAVGESTRNRQDLIIL